MERWKFYSEVLERTGGAWTSRFIAREEGRALSRLRSAIPQLTRLEYFEVVPEIAVEKGDLRLVVYLQASPQLFLLTEGAPVRRGRSRVEVAAVNELAALRDSIGDQQAMMDSLAPRLRTFEVPTAADRDKGDAELTEVVKRLSGRVLSFSFPEGDETLCIPTLPQYVPDSEVTKLRVRVKRLGDRRVECAYAYPVDSSHPSASLVLAKGFSLLPHGEGGFTADQRARLAASWEAKALLEVHGHLVRSVFSEQVVGLALRAVSTSSAAQEAPSSETPRQEVIA